MPPNNTYNHKTNHTMKHLANLMAMLLICLFTTVACADQRGSPDVENEQEQIVQVSKDFAFVQDVHELDHQIITANRQYYFHIISNHTLAPPEFYWAEQTDIMDTQKDLFSIPRNDHDPGMDNFPKLE